MPLLFLMSIPALSALITMVAAITELTLHPRLQGRPCQVIPFPSPVDRKRRPTGSRMAG